jgi:ribosomal 30S subunit maturation factor RimM
VVKRNGKEIYIPLHDDFILDINEDTETMKLSLPEGLLEIND